MKILVIEPEKAPYEKEIGDDILKVRKKISDVKMR